MDVLEAAEGQAEVVEPVRERRSRHGDAEPARVGEVRQPEPPRLVALAEDDLPLGAMQRPPGADAPLERAAHTRPEIGVATHELLEDRHRPQPRHGLEHRHDLVVEHALERVGAPPAARDALGRGRARILRDPVARGRAEPRLRGGHGDRVGRTMRHEEPHLVIGHVAAGHGALLTMEKAPLYLGRPRSPGAPPAAGADTTWPGPPVGLRPPFGPGRAAPSHPDRRANFILIVAPHAKAPMIRIWSNPRWDDLSPACARACA